MKSYPKKSAAKRHSSFRLRFFRFKSTAIATDAQEKRTAVSPEEMIDKLRRKAAARRDLRTFAYRLAVLVALIGMVFGVIFELVPAPDDDMKPAIRYRDLQLVYRWPDALWMNDPVVYTLHGQKRTGRIVGRPGDSVEITEDHQLRVNGANVYEGEIYYSTPAYDSNVVYPVVLKSDEYFVLSDFREGAFDSRQFGVLKLSAIDGKVITILRRSGL